MFSFQLYVKWYKKTFEVHFPETYLYYILSHKTPQKVFCLKQYCLHLCTVEAKCDSSLFHHACLSGRFCEVSQSSLPCPLPSRLITDPDWSRSPGWQPWGMQTCHLLAEVMNWLRSDMNGSAGSFLESNEAALVHMSVSCSNRLSSY